MNIKNFFGENQRKTVLEKFKHQIDRLPISDDFEKQRNNLIKLVVSSMASKPEQWDWGCAINIGWIGDRFINSLSDDGFNLTKTELDDICSMCFRFLFELYLSTKNELAGEFESAKKFVFNNISRFEPKAQESIEYAIREMPISIIKAVANSDSINSLKKIGETIEAAEILKSNWDADLLEKEKQVNALKDSLAKYENAFNFVGLYQGFDDLAQQKLNEKNGILFWIKFLSVLIVLPVAFELGIIYSNLGKISEIKDGLLVSIFPTVSLVAISVYYFRVLLFNYKSVKSQLLQIDLRKTLCRFIQNYSDYSQKIKKQDINSLDKFENIIFSGIVTDDGNLPSTFDGFDQLGKLIKSIKS